MLLDHISLNWVFALHSKESKLSEAPQRRKSIDNVDFAAAFARASSLAPPRNPRIAFVGPRQKPTRPPNPLRRPKRRPLQARSHPAKRQTPAGEPPSSRPSSLQAAGRLSSDRQHLRVPLRDLPDSPAGAKRPHPAPPTLSSPLICKPEAPDSQPASDPYASYSAHGSSPLRHIGACILAKPLRRPRRRLCRAPHGAQKPRRPCD